MVARNRGRNNTVTHQRIGTERIHDSAAAGAPEAAVGRSWMLQSRHTQPLDQKQVSLIVKVSLACDLAPVQPS